MSEELVFPSSVLCVVEEFFPGENCYIDNDKGYIRASVVGRPILDINNRVIRVSSWRRKRHHVPKEGSTVIGIVQTVRTDYLLSTIIGLVENKKALPTGPFAGILHVSQASTEYVKSLSDLFSVGDIIYARVQNNYNPYQLSTKSPGLGVILSYCGQCGHVLLFKEGRLVCPRCKMSYNRHISKFYHNISLE